jgi:hypothetical protein
MNNYFCVLPFYGVEIAHNIPKNIYCCRLPPGTNIKSVQQSIIDQQRSPACSACWKLEDSGLTSERQLHNSAFDFYLDRDIEKIEHDAVSQLHQSQIIKLGTSNLCNGTCVTCGSDASSAWAALENKAIDYKKISLEKIESIDWANIKQLSFVGGEPLLERLNFEILQRLVKLGNVNCFVSIVTNGSVALTTAQFQLLSEFKNLNICLSIDGVGKRFEYLRYPLNWNLLCENLNHFRSITDNISVSAMISNVNVFYYSELIEFFADQKLPYLCKQVEQPRHFSPGNLPDEFKQKVLDHNGKNFDQVKSFLNIGSFSPAQFQKSCEEIHRQDQLKKINIADYLPTNFLQKPLIEFS